VEHNVTVTGGRAGLADRILRNRAAGEGSLLPYFTAGFPNTATVAELILRADAVGVAVIEIGVPYSDSIADGPVIQGSFHHALAHGFKVDDCFSLVESVRPSVSCGLVVMVSCSIVYRTGLGLFMNRAAAAGFDGIILPDVPVEESAAAAGAAGDVGLSFIGMIAPGTSLARRQVIVRSSSGFLYRIAVAGTTGERAGLPADLGADVAELRGIGGLPVCIGFGVSTPRQVREVCTIAEGAIVGSAIIRRIFDGLNRGLEGPALIDSVAAFLSDLMTGTKARGTP